MDKPQVMIIKTREVREVTWISFNDEESIVYVKNEDGNYSHYLHSEIVLIKNGNLEPLINTKEKESLLKEAGLI